MYDNSPEQWFLFVLVVMGVFCPLFVVANKKMFKGERIAAGVFSACISFLVGFSFLKNPELFEVLLGLVAVLFVLLVILVFVVIITKRKK